MNNIYEEDGKLTKLGTIVLTFTIIAALQKAFQLYKEFIDDPKNQSIELPNENKKST